MARRKAQSNPCDLFAFQDIISATIGILLIITCLLSLLKPAALALPVVTEEPIEPETPAPTTVDDSVVVAQQEAYDRVKELEKELANYIQGDVDQIEATPLPMLVRYTLSGNVSINNYRILVAQGSQTHIYSSDRTTVVAAIPNDVNLWRNILKHTQGNNKVIMLVKPSAIPYEKQLRSVISSGPQGIVRYEYIHEDTVIQP